MLITDTVDNCETSSDLVLGVRLLALDLSLEKEALKGRNDRGFVILSEDVFLDDDTSDVDF